jgi:hypothetical protein
MEGRGRFTLRHSTGMWMRYECWWRLGLRWMHPMPIGSLHIAAWRGHSAVVKTLVELGLTRRQLVLTERDRCMHMAALQGHVVVVTTLVELGADIGALNGSGEMHASPGQHPQR